MIEVSQQISINQLFQLHGETLDLSWEAGRKGKSNIVVPESSETARIFEDDDDVSAGEVVEDAVPGKKALVGYLNLIHPHQIQIIGNVELKYIESLRDITRHDAVKQLFRNAPACIIISNNQRVPVFMKRKCNEKNVPLFTSSLDSAKLAESLHYYLTNIFADSISLHGVFMEIMSIGVLITGPPGVGKSELALELITRGHRLIADDAPNFSRIAPDIINGTCPEALIDFLEVRGLGIINIRKLYGNTAIKSNKYLRLIVRLEPMSKEQMLQLDRLEGSHRTLKVLDMDVPEITLPVAPGRNLAILLEAAARNHALRISGYSASDEFIHNQQQMINNQKNG
jgi:HPr kinase/phosphorylase